MNDELSFVGILDIIAQCTLDTRPKNTFLLEVIDNMMIEGYQNPLEELQEDSLSRIFNGSNPFAQEYAKKIYHHKDDRRLVKYLRGLGEPVIRNIVLEIQSDEREYEFDLGCCNLSELMFSKLKMIIDVPKKQKKIVQRGSENLKRDDKTLSIIESAIIVGLWDESNVNDISFIELISGNDYRSFSRELFKKKIVTISFPTWTVNEREERLSDLCSRLRIDDIRHIFSSIKSFESENKDCSKLLIQGVLGFITYLSNQRTNTLYSPSDYDVCLHGFLRDLTMIVDDNPNSIIASAFPLLVEINYSYFISILAGTNIVNCISDVDDANKHYYQEALVKAGEYDQFFIDSARLLFRYSERDSYFYESLVGMFLGWDPRTEASSEKKVGMLRGFVKDNPSLVKRMVFDLLPGGKSYSTPVPEVFYATKPFIKEVSFTEYWKYESDLLLLLFEKYNLDRDDYICLISRLSLFSEQVFQLLLNKISELIVNMNEDDRTFVMEQLSKNMIQKGLSDNKVESIKQVFLNHNYSYVSCLGKELFAYSAIVSVRSSRGVFENKEELETARQEKCKELYDMNGVEGVLSFLQLVEDKYYYGVSIFNSLKLEDVMLIVQETSDMLFVRGIASQVSQSYMSLLADKGLFGAVAKYMTIDDNLMAFLLSKTKKEQNSFWRSFDGMISDAISIDNLKLVVVGLKKNNPDKALVELFMHRDQINDTFIDDVYCILEKTASSENARDYIFLTMLNKLRVFDYDSDCLVKLELISIRRFAREHAFKPLSIHAKMANDADFFVEVIERKYRLEDYYYSLLNGWEILPGISASGFDVSAFDEWYNRVREKANENIFSLSNIYIGKAIYRNYERNRDEFYNSDLAKVFEECNEDVHEGFSFAPNYCISIIPDSSDMPEYDDYKKQANRAISLGYINIARSLERIAYRFYDMYSRT